MSAPEWREVEAAVEGVFCDCRPTPGQAHSIHCSWLSQLRPHDGQSPRLMDVLLAALRPLWDRRARALAEAERLKQAIRAGSAAERVRIVLEFGDCCVGADPACMGPRGCTMIQAMNRPEVQAAAGAGPLSAELAEAKRQRDQANREARTWSEEALRQVGTMRSELAEASAALAAAAAREGALRAAAERVDGALETILDCGRNDFEQVGGPEATIEEQAAHAQSILRVLLAAAPPPDAGSKLLELVAELEASDSSLSAIADRLAELGREYQHAATRGAQEAWRMAARRLREALGLPPP